MDWLWSFLGILTLIIKEQLYKKNSLTIYRRAFALRNRTLYPYVMILQVRLFKLKQQQLKDEKKKKHLQANDSFCNILGCKHCIFKAQKPTSLYKSAPSKKYEICISYISVGEPWILTILVSNPNNTPWLCRIATQIFMTQGFWPIYREN